MAIITYGGHANRAKAWFNQDNIFFVIGQQSDWTDEPTPPPETEDETITDPIFYKKVEQKYYVVRDDENGTISYRDGKYRIIQEENLISEQCRWVLMTSWLNYDEAPVDVGYRKIGITTGLVRASGVPSAQYGLLPTEVANPGVLEVVANDTVTVRSANKRERLAILVEF